MRAAAAIARSILAAQGATLAAAAGLGLVLAAINAGWPEHRPALYALRVPLAAGGLLGAFLVGMTLLGEELATGRLGFWFARPISAWSIWGGKLAGVVLLGAALQVAVLVPTLGTGPAELDHGASLALRWTVLAAASGLLGGVLARGRSRMAWVNWVGLVAVVLLLGREVLLVDGTPGSRERFGVVGDVTVTAATLACLLGSAAAVVVGRTSPGRAHLAGSIAAWVAVVPAALLLLALVEG
jgi:hypothetical protein